MAYGGRISREPKYSRHFRGLVWMSWQHLAARRQIASEKGRVFRFISRAPFHSQVFGSARPIGSFCNSAGHLLTAEDAERDGGNDHPRTDRGFNRRRLDRADPCPKRVESDIEQRDETQRNRGNRQCAACEEN